MNLRDVFMLDETPETPDGQAVGSSALFGGFDWEAFRKLQDSIGPIEEKVIHQQLIQTMEGNDCVEDFGTAEKNIAADFFHLGWLCARLALSPNT